MKYCSFDGCTKKIESGTYCDDHQSRRKSKVKKDIYHHDNKPFYRSQAWKDMRDFVYQREGGCCQRCGRFVFGRQAHIHHIVPIKDNGALKLDPNNLMLLCSKCHPIVENETDEKKVFPSYF